LQGIYTISLFPFQFSYNWLRDLIDFIVHLVFDNKIRILWVLICRSIGRHQPKSKWKFNIYQNWARICNI